MSKDLRVQFFTMRAEEKPAALLHLLQEVIPADQQTVRVFVDLVHKVASNLERFLVRVQSSKSQGYA